MPNNITINSALVTKAQAELNEKYKAILEPLGQTYESLPALVKHILAFSELNENGNVVMSSDAIAAVLKALNEPNPGRTGMAINFFNATHANRCPIGKTEIFNVEDKNFGKYLHQGTLRLYGVDGSFDSALWSSYIQELPDPDWISSTELDGLLKKVVQHAQPETRTGRHGGGLFKVVQETAGSAAWHELFTLFVGQWRVDEQHPGNPIPMIQTTLLQRFFEDSGVANYLAKKAGLPVKMSEVGTPEIQERKFCC